MSLPPRYNALPIIIILALNSIIGNVECYVNLPLSSVKTAGSKIIVNKQLEPKSPRTDLQSFLLSPSNIHSLEHYNNNMKKHVHLLSPMTPLSSKKSTQRYRSFSTSTTSLQCQLLGMNCARPTDFTFSFTGFARRGGETDVHSDGWGLAFYEGRGVRAFHDPLPAASSPIAAMIAAYPCRTYNMISHIRYATEGAVALENVHPFQREMWGIQWVFAHNGDVPRFSSGLDHPWIGDTDGEKTYIPVGETDSEAIFCGILNALRSKFDTIPTLPVLYKAMEDLCQKIVYKDDGTIFNFLLGCGEHIQFAYSFPGSRPGSKVWNGLYYTIREPPFQTAKLSDCDYTVDFSECTSDEDRVAVIATFPLTEDEVWVEVKKGELILFDDGLPHVAANDCVKTEILGHGLVSRVLPNPLLTIDQRHQIPKYGFTQDI